MKAEWKVVNKMYQSGSGFESRLAELWMHSDLNNQSILETAFANIFKKYLDNHNNEPKPAPKRDIALERRALALSLRGRG
jgi:hypothetical protein